MNASRLRNATFSAGPEAGAAEASAELLNVNCEEPTASPAEGRSTKSEGLSSMPAEAGVHAFVAANEQQEMSEMTDGAGCRPIPADTAAEGPMVSVSAAAEVINVLFANVATKQKRSARGGRREQRESDAAAVPMQQQPGVAVPAAGAGEEEGRAAAGGSRAAKRVTRATAGRVAARQREASPHPGCSRAVSKAQRGSSEAGGAAAADAEAAAEEVRGPAAESKARAGGMVGKSARKKEPSQPGAYEAPLSDKAGAEPPPQQLAPRSQRRRRAHDDSEGDVQQQETVVDPTAVSHPASVEEKKPVNSYKRARRAKSPPVDAHPEQNEEGRGRKGRDSDREAATDPMKSAEEEDGAEAAAAAGKARRRGIRAADGAASEIPAAAGEVAAQPPAAFSEGRRGRGRKGAAATAASEENQPHQLPSAPPAALQTAAAAGKKRRAAQALVPEQAGDAHKRSAIRSHQVPLPESADEEPPAVGRRTRQRQQGPSGEVEAVRAKKGARARDAFGDEEAGSVLPAASPTAAGRAKRTRGGMPLPPSAKGPHKTRAK